MFDRNPPQIVGISRPSQQPFCERLPRMNSQPKFGAIRAPNKTKKTDDSVNRLKKLGFEPIEQLVLLHERLEREHEYHCSLRDGTNTGPVRVRYSLVAHTALLSQLEKVASQLLRYRWARVSETVVLDTGELPAFNIHLHE